MVFGMRRKIAPSYLVLPFLDSLSAVRGSAEDVACCVIPRSSSKLREIAFEGYWICWELRKKLTCSMWEKGK